MKTTFIAIFSLFLLGSAFGQMDSSNVISGALRCFDYLPLPGQTVVLTDTLSGVAVEQAVDSSGLFTFRNVPTGRTYRLSLKDELPPINLFKALSVLDMVKLRLHVLGIRRMEGFALYAGDMNQSLGLSTFDLVLISKILLGHSNTETDTIKPTLALLHKGKIYSQNIILDFTTSLQGLQFVYFIKGDVDGSGCP